jgi:hypothetical protein
MPCQTTYRLSVELQGAAFNIHSLFGTTANPMVLPAAYQVAGDYGANVGGVSPLLFADSPVSEFDSWLTVGATDGTVTFSTLGIDFPSWAATSGITVDDGAVMLFSDQEDESWIGVQDGNAPIVVGQITTPTTADVVTVTLNFQGNTQDRNQGVFIEDATEDWRHLGVVFELSNSVTCTDSTDGQSPACEDSATFRDAFNSPCGDWHAGHRPGQTCAEAGTGWGYTSDQIDAVNAACALTCESCVVDDTAGPTAGATHSTCPEAEHDGCCACLSDEGGGEPDGDWDTGACCGHCTAMCRSSTAPTPAPAPAAAGTTCTGIGAPTNGGLGDCPADGTLPEGGWCTLSCDEGCEPQVS